MYQQQQTTLTAASGGSISNIPSMISTGRASGIGKRDVGGGGLLNKPPDAVRMPSWRRRPQEAEVLRIAVKWWTMRGAGMVLEVVWTGAGARARRETREMPPSSREKRPKTLSLAATSGW